MSTITESLSYIGTTLAYSTSNALVTALNSLGYAIKYVLTEDGKYKCKQCSKKYKTKVFMIKHTIEDH
jgi:hypothetical protein